MLDLVDDLLLVYISPDRHICFQYFCYLFHIFIIIYFINKLADITEAVQSSHREKIVSLIAISNGHVSWAQEVTEQWHHSEGSFSHEYALRMDFRHMEAVLLTCHAIIVQFPVSKFNMHHAD